MKTFKLDCTIPLGSDGAKIIQGYFNSGQVTIKLKSLSQQESGYFLMIEDEDLFDKEFKVFQSDLELLPKKVENYYYQRFSDIFDGSDYVYTERLPVGVADGNFDIPNHFGYHVIATWKSGGRGNNAVLACKPKLSQIAMINVVNILKTARFSNDEEEFTLTNKNLIIKTKKVGSWIGKGGWRIKNLNIVYPTVIK